MKLSDIVEEFLKELKTALDPTTSVIFRSGTTFVPDSSRRGFWTHVMLNSLLRMGKRSGFTTFPSNYYLSVDRRGQYHNCRYEAKTDESEFMLDVVWGKWSTQNRWWRESLDSATRMGITLACESEWGWLEGKNEEHHLDLTFNDFAKLVAVKAPLKILIANSASRAMTTEIFECAEAMARRALGVTQESYALLIWDYDASWHQHRAAPTIRMFDVS